jgi:very-short-patch-repair endonuclease
MPHSNIPPEQRKRAKALRQTMTRAETLLWRYLKAGHLDGVSFRRQTPIGDYIVDFASHAAKLVIEVDGYSHDFAQAQRRDSIRDAWLASRGYRVLRFTNEDVLSNLEGVLIVIREAAAARTRGQTPSLSLPRKGGGNPTTAASHDGAGE